MVNPLREERCASGTFTFPSMCPALLARLLCSFGKLTGWRKWGNFTKYHSNSTVETGMCLNSWWLSCDSKYGVGTNSNAKTPVHTRPMNSESSFLQYPRVIPLPINTWEGSRLYFFTFKNTDCLPQVNGYSLAFVLCGFYLHGSTWTQGQQTRNR